jgi:hypothetical protein
MANYLKTDIYKKSYLLEFWDENETKVEEAFTFSVPPESEELTYTQRKTETKTFGGLHVDDYGIDAVKITLSGSTVNQDLKKIYRPGKSDKWLTGEEEIYLLRDLLAKYKTGTENIKKKIMLYDLSKGANGSQVMGLIKNVWHVFPGDFKIRRASDRPFTYKYSIDFTGVAEVSDALSKLNRPAPPPELDPGKLGLLQSIMEKLIAVLDFIDKINGYVNDVLSKINEVSKLLKVLGNIMTYAAATIAGIMNSIGAATAGLIDGITGVVTGVNSIIKLPQTISQQALNIGAEILNATTRLAQAVSALSEKCNEDLGPDGYYSEIPQETLTQYGMTGAEFKDTVGVMLNQAEDIANELVVAAKSADIPEVTIGNPNPEAENRAVASQNTAADKQTGGGQAGAVTQTAGIRAGVANQTIVLSYGHQDVAVKSTDSLESLAAEYCGGADRAIDVAAYNGIASLDELRPGDTLKMPILQKGQRNSNNRIYARREDRDNYGRDIYIDDEGYTAASESGDYKLAKGTSNLSQAILLRLRENVNKRVRLNAYGIRTNISDPAAGIAYILSSIDLTVRGDPRVRSVDDIRFAGKGDSLNVTVKYRDINNAVGMAAGGA